MAMRSVCARGRCARAVGCAVRSVLNFSAKRDKRKLSRRIFLVPPRTARTRNVSHSRRFLAAVTEPVHVCAVCPPVIGRRGGGGSLLPVVLRLQEVELLLNPVYRLSDGQLEGRRLAVAAAAGRSLKKKKETKKNAIKRLNLGRRRSRRQRWD